MGNIVGMRSSQGRWSCIGSINMRKEDASYGEDDCIPW